MGQRGNGDRNETEGKETGTRQRGNEDMNGDRNETEGTKTGMGQRGNEGRNETERERRQERDREGRE
ncbi:hypothetical protein Pmani_033357 [Petrolisthes manimaculis]|uniref:Uncharacterized protein n=1 Tax=Petrolisthes manimaculis TaxID=1843537 RepID=A0AAE1TSQ9_9EUCA|nr:hypothetical protein Pmani_033357 [Petrolisthes manimaculis]